MFDLYEELASAIDALEQSGVPYALCGGLAMAVHGFTRATGDVWTSRQTLIWRDHPVSVFSREGLITLKRFRSSKQDLVDIERLETDE